MKMPIQLRGQVSDRMSGVSEALVITSACVGFVVVALLIAITAVYARRQRTRKARGKLASAEVRRDTAPSKLLCSPVDQLALLY